MEIDVSAFGLETESATSAAAPPGDGQSSDLLISGQPPGPTGATTCGAGVDASVDDSTPNGQTSRKQHHKRKRGAPNGNANAATHGLRGSSLPPGNFYLEGQLAAFRRYLRDELVRVHGPGNVGILHEALVQSAIRHETRALLAARWLRIEKDLKLEARLGLLATISAATDSRDKCLRSMGLDKLGDAGSGSIMSAFVGPAIDMGPAPAAPTEAAPTAPQPTTEGSQDEPN